MIRRLLKIVFSVTVFAVSFTTATAQHIAVKTNVPYWGTATPNAAVELRLADRWTADFSIGYNPFTFSNNKKLKHIAIQPEARYWLCAPFSGHFVGANLLYSHYNAGGIKFPFGIFSRLNNHRFQGDLGAFGLAYGYSWMLPNRRWSIEAEVGLGIGYTHYKEYACEVCGSRIGSEGKWFFLPTRLAINMIYYLW